MISPPFFGKKELTKKEYIGSFAVQLINGVSSMVIFRSRSLVRVRVAITAGTVHPNPINIGTMLRPDKPILRNSLSITNATRAIYPLSSIRDKKKNRVTIMGRKLSTLPTPVKIPSITRLCIALFTWAAVNVASASSDTLSIPISSRLCSQAPITLKVR